MDIFIKKLELFYQIREARKTNLIYCTNYGKKIKNLNASDRFYKRKYGRNAISIAQAGINNDWKMKESIPQK